MQRISGRATVLVLALALSPLAVTTAAEGARSAPAARAGVAAAPTPAPAVPVVAWTDCGQPGGGPAAECATVRVPLDYDDPTGPKVRLDVLRVPAGDPAHRIGTLFVNPGGPGAPSRDFAAAFGQFVPASVSRRFDVVGVDARGTGPSAPALCRTQERPPRFPGTAFPVTATEVRHQIALDGWVRRACRTGGRPILQHMSTADTARDMDLVRQALGEPRLSYYGVSYGTQLGTTYAAMFPGKVRAMILDGVLDPVEWSTGRAGDRGRPFSERLGSGYGAWQSLTNALAECDRVGRARCPIGGDAAQVWTDVVHRLHRGPVRGLHYADVVSQALGSLYDARSLRSFMGFLGRVHRALFSAQRTARPLPRLARPSTGPGTVPGPYSAIPRITARDGYGVIESTFPGVACADSDNPSREQEWVAAARRADRRSPWFGAVWTWASSTCAGWPARTQADRFTGPYHVRTAAPVLVVGNTFDPATPLHGARAVNRLLVGSRLLVMDGWGHGALGNGPCIRTAYASYLLRGDLPAPGTVCRPGRQPFPPVR